MSPIKLIVFALIVFVSITTVYSKHRKFAHKHSGKRFSHGHANKTKKASSLTYSKYYDPSPKQSTNWNYGNTGSQPAYTAPKQKWTKPGYNYQSKSSPAQGYNSPYYSPNSKNTAMKTKQGQSQNSLSPQPMFYAPKDPKSKGINSKQGSGQQQDYSNLYYGSDTKSKGSGQQQDYSNLYYGSDTKSKASQPVSSGGSGQQQGYSDLYYGSDTKSKSSQPVSSGGYKMKQKTPAQGYGNYYQRGSYGHRGSGATQNKQPSVSFSNYYDPPDKGNQPVKSNQPSANSYQPSANRGNKYNSMYQGSQSKSSPQQGYSHLYYSPDTKSKGSYPSSGASRYGGNFNSRPSSSNGKSQQQWSNNNAEPAKKPDEPSQSYLNYYSHRKRSQSGNATVSTSTGEPGFIAEFFHEHIIGTASTTTKSDDILGSMKRDLIKRRATIKRHVAAAKIKKKKRNEFQKFNQTSSYNTCDTAHNIKTRIY